MYELKVGAAEAGINPPEELFPFRKYENSFFEGCLDELKVKAIVLDNGETRFLILGMDVGDSLDGEQKKIITDTYGFDYEHILNFNTHNHSAPHWGHKPAIRGIKPEDQDRCETAYEKTVMQGIHTAIKGALASLRPAKYGFGTGYSYINTNRDQLFEDGFWMQGQNYAGFSDKTLAVLKFEDYDGHLIAAMLNYCCHACCAFTRRDFDGKVKITPEFPGYACNYIKQRFGGDPVIVWSSGAAGDQNPMFSSEGFPRIYEPDGYSESIDTPDGTQYIIQRHWGFQHAIDAIAIINSITDMKPRMRITTSSITVKLDGQKAPEGADMQYNRLLVDNFLRGYRPELFENGKRPEKKLVEMIPSGTVDLLMQLAILGDMAFVGEAAEPYCRIGYKCKQASPFRNTVVVTHTDGRKAGYILDDESKDHKVFQSFAKVRPGDNDNRIVKGMLDMFDDALNK
jgi:neutral ceramidase